MICDELLSKDARQNANVRGTRQQAADFGRYQRLHPQGRDLIKGWFDRAWGDIDCVPQESFEPFIYTWISFNGWAACVTEYDSDRQWIDALMPSDFLQEEFLRLANSSGSRSYEAAKDFHSLWPVFEVRALRRRQVPRVLEGSRTEIVKHYLKHDVKEMQPDCALMHFGAQEDIPLDWPHTLAALYRVRCNLFHGEKAPYSDNDRQMVHSSFQLLANFMYESEHVLGEEE